MNPTKQVVTLLLVLQIVSVVYLWIVTFTGTLSAGKFAIFLAIDLLSFAIVVHVYTREKWAETVNPILVLMASVALIVLLISSLYLS